MVAVNFTAANTTHAGRPKPRPKLPQFNVPPARLVVSFGTPSGWPSHMLDIAATSACAERNAARMNEIIVGGGRQNKAYFIAEYKERVVIQG